MIKVGLIPSVGVLVFLQLGMACTTATLVQPVADQIQQIKERKTAIPSDLLEGAATVESQTLLVNRDFNMAMAMSIELVGPAIAAGQRIADNENLAKKLAKSYDSGTARAKLTRLLSDCGTPCARDQAAFSSYAILYGQESARLLTILEWNEKDPQLPSSLIAVSTAKNLEGKDSWIEKDSIQNAHELGNRRLVDLLKQKPKLPSGNPSENAECAWGDQRKFTGHVLAKTPDSTLIHNPDYPRLVVACPVKQE